MATLKKIIARAPRLVANRPLTTPIELARALQQFAADVYAFAMALLSARRHVTCALQCYLGPGGGSTLAGSWVVPCDGQLLEVWAINDLSPTGADQTLTLEIDGVAQSWLSFSFPNGGTLNVVQRAVPNKPVRVRRGSFLAFYDDGGAVMQSGQAEITPVIHADLVEV